jgi:23S rRNA-/tRNA-specific pseudouridylate synthase
MKTLVKIDLETGRKHQIRAQMAHIGHPIVGDVKYGAPQQFHQKDIALHAYSLSFPHPITNKAVTVSTMPPDVWRQRFGSEVMNAVSKLIEAETDS